jgi:hypothetical protein
MSKCWPLYGIIYKSFFYIFSTPDFLIILSWLLKYSPLYRIIYNSLLHFFLSPDFLIILSSLSSSSLILSLTGSYLAFSSVSWVL